MMSKSFSSETPGTPAATSPAVSVVVPVLNEAENISFLVQEIADALAHIAEFEIIFVDDGSTDATPQVLSDLRLSVASLRFLRHKKPSGQSAAVHTGVRAASFQLIATLDGDGQNVPADIPELLHHYLLHSGPDGKLLVAGWRKGRKDKLTKRIASKIANSIRSTVLGDKTPDTGCGLKVFRRDDYLSFPAFNHMHRFLPALMIRSGGRVLSAEVSHRPRQQGVSNYGILDRLWFGVSDLFGVAWLTRRSVNVVIETEKSSEQDTKT